jgi:hypothetical protein
VNFFNAIADGDKTRTPLQFVYEAADCRLWYQEEHMQRIQSLWITVAAQAFGLGGATPYSLCVEGSTGHPTSLSGNAQLFGNGQIVNVTGYRPEDVSFYDDPLFGDSGSGSPTDQTGATGTQGASISATGAANNAGVKHGHPAVNVVVAVLIGLLMSWRGLPTKM